MSNLLKPPRTLSPVVSASVWRCSSTAEVLETLIADLGGSISFIVLVAARLRPSRNPSSCLTPSALRFAQTLWLSAMSAYTLHSARNFFVDGMHIEHTKQPICSLSLENLPQEPLDVHVRVPARSKIVKMSVTLHTGDSGFACRNNENSSDLGTLSWHFHTAKYSWVFSLFLVTKEQQTTVLTQAVVHRQRPVRNFIKRPSLVSP